MLGDVEPGVKEVDVATLIVELGIVVLGLIVLFGLSASQSVLMTSRTC